MRLIGIVPLREIPSKQELKAFMKDVQAMVPNKDDYYVLGAHNAVKIPKMTRTEMDTFNIYDTCAFSLLKKMEIPVIMIP